MRAWWRSSLWARLSPGEGRDMPGCEEKENSRERLVHDRICASNVQAMGRAGILVKQMCWGLQGFLGEENLILHWFNVWCP